MWSYDGVVPGRFVEVEQGEKVKLRVKNALPATHPKFGHEFTTSTHLHGSASLPQFDGYASDITAPGQYKDYWYPNWQNARTLWFHDHGVHHTAENAYGGLAACFTSCTTRPSEQLLPQGEYNDPITLTDVQFAADGTLSYDDHTRSGLWGDVILVNGVGMAAHGGEDAPRLPVPHALRRHLTVVQPQGWVVSKGVPAVRARARPSPCTSSRPTAV